MVQALNLSAAVNHARHIDCELNAWITIHFDEAPSPMDGADRLQLLFRRARIWWGRRHRQFTYGYVRENPPSKGDHVHILAHVPAGHWKTFIAALTSWVALDADWVGIRAIKVKRVEQGTEHRIVRYMLKGGLPEVRRAFRVRTGLKALQGKIEGKRVGVSRNIDAEARSMALEGAGDE